MSSTTLEPEVSPPDGAQAGPAPPDSGFRRRLAWLLSAISVVSGIGLWQLVAALGVKGIPGPGEVAAQIWSMLGDGTLESDGAASLRRVLIGFGLGTAAAIPVGVLMGWYPAARALFEPWIQFFRVIPPMATLPLVIVLLGIGEAPKIAVIFMASFLSSTVSAYQGVVSVDRTLIDAARVLLAPPRIVFARVVAPAATPYLFVGARIGLGASWSTLIAAELVAAQEGLGFRIQQAQLYYDLKTIFADIVVIGVLGLAMDRLLVAAEHRVGHWQERRVA